MNCEKCGYQLNDEKFCPNCGRETYYVKTDTIYPRISQDKWYIRFVKVVYIGLHIPLPFVIYGVWMSNDPYSYYSSYSHEYITYGSYGEAFWYSLLTLVIWIIILRLIKIAIFYIFIGEKPQWKIELKKFL